MFIILIHYKKPLSDVDTQLQEHRLFLDKGYQNNLLVASGPCNPRTGGVIISNALKREDVEALIAEDPFHKHEIADYEIIEFDPVKFHPDFTPFLAR